MCACVYVCKCGVDGGVCGVHVAVCLVISSVPIDLSQYAGSIMEKAIPHLSSQNSATRHACRELMCALAKQCSDGSSVSNGISLLSTTLKSTNSKL